MGRYAKYQPNSQTEFKQAPEGTHLARCIRIIDLGTQTNEYQGKINFQEQILIFWELPNELSDNGEPLLISKFYTNSFYEKASLRHDLETWRGREFSKEELKVFEQNPFDLQSLLGLPCLLSVVHNDKGRAKVGAVLKAMANMPCPPPHNEYISFWLDEFDQTVFNNLSEKIKDIIKKSPEYTQLMQPKAIQQQQNSEQPHRLNPFEGMKDDRPFD